MKAEHEPVSSDEYVIRAVWTSYYDPEDPRPVHPKAFLPRKDETAGISVFRAACIASPEDVLIVFAEEKRDQYALALLPVSSLLALGLTVQPAKVDQVPGHAVLPELNSLDWKADKYRWVEVQKELAAIASDHITRPPKA